MVQLSHRQADIQVGFPIPYRFGFDKKFEKLAYESRSSSIRVRTWATRWKKYSESSPVGAVFLFYLSAFYITCRKTEFEKFLHYNIKSKFVELPAYLRTEFVRVPGGGWIFVAAINPLVLKFFFSYISNTQYTIEPIEIAPSLELFLMIIFNDF